MLAYVALFLAATVAAMPNASVERRAVLHDTPTQEICDNEQRLVCCGDDNKCGEIKVDDRNKGNVISSYQHCTAIIACCNFQTDLHKGENWGDIYNQCTYAGSLFGNGEGGH